MTKKYSQFPGYAALLYVLLIIYVSLEPFTGWQNSADSFLRFWLWTYPTQYTHFDVFINFLAYLPLGVLLAIAVDTRQQKLRSLAMVTGLAAILSFTLETTQAFLPSRVASPIDWLANLAGSLFGCCFIILLDHSAPWRSWVAALNTRWLNASAPYDIGLALLGGWLLMQINPGISLFSLTYINDLAGHDGASWLLEVAQVTFNFLGISLFTSTLLKKPQQIFLAMIALTSFIALSKTLLAWLMIRPEVVHGWFSSAIWIGLCIGIVWLWPLAHLPITMRRIAASVALLSGLGVIVFTPEVLFAETPIKLFDWNYGHLLNFNGLTHTVGILWPVITAVYLFGLAGLFPNEGKV